MSSICQRPAAWLITSHSQISFFKNYYYYYFWEMKQRNLSSTGSSLRYLIQDSHLVTRTLLLEKFLPSQSCTLTGNWSVECTGAWTLALQYGMQASEPPNQMPKTALLLSFLNVCFLLLSQRFLAFSIPVLEESKLLDLISNEWLWNYLTTLPHWYWKYDVLQGGSKYRLARNQGLLSVMVI